MKKKLTLKLEKGSLPILIAMGFIPLILSALDKFGVISLISQISSLLVILGCGFIFNEQIRKSKKSGRKIFKNTASIVLFLLVFVAFVSSVLSLVGINVPSQLSVFEGGLLIIVIISSVVELFN